MKALNSCMKDDILCANLVGEVDQDSDIRVSLTFETHCNTFAKRGGNEKSKVGRCEGLERVGVP